VFSLVNHATYPWFPDTATGAISSAGQLTEKELIDGEKCQRSEG
jgi:hypothetical protein